MTVSSLKHIPSGHGRGSCPVLKRPGLVGALAGSPSTYVEPLAAERHDSMRSGASLVPAARLPPQRGA
mgnify:FL=1